MRTVSLSEIRPSELALVWNRVLPARYRVSEQVLSANTLGHRLLIPCLSSAVVEGDAVRGFVAAKEPAAGQVYPGEATGQIHVSCLVAPDVSTADSLLGPLLETGRPLVFGQDLGHFFPGVPEDCPELTAQVLAAGFAPTDRVSVDVQRDLAEFELPAKDHEALVAAGATVARLEEGESEGLDSFLASEFPGRWRHDTLSRCREHGEWGNVYVLKKGGSIAGFALTQTWDTTRVPFSGALWHLDMGEQWGALGPIGVARSVRGAGLGGALLGSALKGLSERGVRNCAIDWTNLVEFYGKYGFQVSRRYVTMLHAGLG